MTHLGDSNYFITKQTDKWKQLLHNYDGIVKLYFCYDNELSLGLDMVGIHRYKYIAWSAASRSPFY